MLVVAAEPTAVCNVTCVPVLAGLGPKQTDHVHEAWFVTEVFLGDVVHVHPFQ